MAINLKDIQIGEYIRGKSRPDNLSEGYVFSDDCMLQRIKESDLIIRMFGKMDLDDPLASAPFEIISGEVDDLAGNIYKVGNVVHLDKYDIAEIL